MIWHYTVRRAGEREEHTVQAPTLFQAKVAAADQWRGTSWFVDHDSLEPDDLNEVETSA